MSFLVVMTSEAVVETDCGLTCGLLVGCELWING